MTKSMNRQGMNEREIMQYAYDLRKKLEDRGIDILERTDWAERFRSFGFSMDCGNSYQDAYGLSIDDVEGLKRKAGCIDDVCLLGNAIFSQCRYVTHWAMGPCERETEWLIAALVHLERLIGGAGNNSADYAVRP